VVGGACVNTGTIPSKTLRESAMHLSGFKQRGFRDSIDLSIRADITVADFMYRKQQVVERSWSMIEENFRRHEVDVYRGAARFVSPHCIAVTNALGEQLIEGDIILIATGSSPFRAPDVPFDDLCIFDSDTILSIDAIPKTLAVVGAGVIGCEYAAIFAALGVKVFLIDGRTTLLPHVDRELVRVLLAELQNRLEVDLFLGCDVKSVALVDGRARLTLLDGTVVLADKVLMAAGRVSNTAGLDLAAAGVQTGARGIIPVDASYRTNVENIYAAGDVIGFPALASTSMEQARVAMVHAFDLKYKTRVAPLLPYAIYTIPELATTGLTEEDCRAKGIPCEVGRAFYRNNARGQIIGDTKGLIKLVFDPTTLRLLGIHIVGDSAAELLHVGMMVMQFEQGLDAFIESVFNFPTLGEAYKYAAYDGLGNVARKKRPTLS
jgi:NAD(P) transhydrogenase